MACLSISLHLVGVGTESSWAIAGTYDVMRLYDNWMIESVDVAYDLVGSNDTICDMDILGLCNMLFQKCGTVGRNSMHSMPILENIPGRM